MHNHIQKKVKIISINDIQILLKINWLLNILNIRLVLKRYQKSLIGTYALTCKC